MVAPFNPPPAVPFIAPSASAVAILGTGGTIAGRSVDAGDNLGYTAGQVAIDALVQAIPGLGAGGIATEQIAQIDSKDMDFSVWQRLALRCAHWLAQPGTAGVVVTHGTDTLEETAYFLHRVLAPQKPVVLACAMRPASSLQPDGPQNLLDAVRLARWPGARGVLAVCAGQVHGAAEVQKDHTYRLDAFSSGDAGPLGRLREGQLDLWRNWPPAQDPPGQAAIENIAKLTDLPRVEWITGHAGADGAVVDALLAQRMSPPLRGLVVAGTGNGTLHRGLAQALLRAQAQGVRVVRSTRCPFGGVMAAPGAVEALPATHLSPAKARIALMLELAGVCPMDA